MWPSLTSRHLERIPFRLRQLDHRFGYQVIRKKTMTLYVTLFADTSLGTYPENTISKFQTGVASSLVLYQGAWEIVLCELAFENQGTASERYSYFCLLSTKRIAVGSHNRKFVSGWPQRTGKTVLRTLGEYVLSYHCN